MRFLVTGASGFIGGHLCRHLLDAGHTVRTVATREIVRGTPESLRAACREIDVIFHLAGRAHRGHRATPGMLAACRQANVALTLALASAAREAGVGRLVYASSVTVYGEASPPGAAFREASPLAPTKDPYARSKQEAEALLRAPDFQALHPVIVRLPLVHGPGVKGNLRALLRLVDCGLPLPFAGIDNRRSLVGINNLMSFLFLAATHAQAAGQTLLVSDREDVSTAGLLAAIAQGLQKRLRLFRAEGLLRAASVLPWARNRCRKLTGDFRIDPSRSCDLLNWRPAVGFATGIAQMCADYGSVKK
jgi:nucleoside-diphosphate-sugar epimerase